MSRFIAIVPLVITGIVLFVIPNITPRYSLFGVRIEPEFRQSPAARQAICRFRLVVLAALLAAAALITGDPRWATGLAGAPVVIIGAAAGAWIWQYRTLRSFGLSRSALRDKSLERSVALSTAPDQMPSWFGLGLLPFLALAGVALYLRVHWSHIPEQFAVHWGIDGQPNGWAERTIHGVFGPLILCGVLDAWMMVFSAVIWHGSRRSAYRTGLVQLLLVTEAAVTVIFSLVAMTPVWHLSQGVIVFLILGLVAGFIALAIWRAGEINAHPSAADDQTDPDSWHGGLLYYNPKDPAIAVPRRDGFGFTLNTARPAAWVLALGSAVTICGCILWMG